MPTASNTNTSGALLQGPKSGDGLDRVSTFEVMKASPRWLFWRYAPSAKPGGKRRKVPFYIDGTERKGTLDSPEDFARLVTFEDAQRALVLHPRWRLGFALGYDAVLNAWWQGVDFDNCLDGIEKAPGYVETSVSGNGYHVIGLGAWFETVIDPTLHMEAYAGRRFFAIGDLVRDGPLVDLTTTWLGRIVQACPTGPVVRAGAMSGREVETLSHSQRASLRRALHRLDPDPYEVWYRVAMALKTVVGGEDLFLEWSEGSAKFSASEARQKFRHIKSDRTHWRAIFGYAKNRIYCRGD
jgi:hypothetical protein